MEITFKRENGQCPYFNYKGTHYYLLEDNRFGGYEWCLMCYKLNTFEKKFKSELELRNWLYDDDMTEKQFEYLKEKFGQTAWYRNIIHKNCDYSDSAWLAINGKDYNFDKKNLIIKELPKRNQLTSWGTYEEILQEAKNYLQKLMDEEVISLF